MSIRATEPHASPLALRHMRASRRRSRASSRPPRLTATVLTELGVPDEAIVRQQGHTRNTREEAAAAARLVRERGWKRVGVVTSAWHMRRALGLFRRAGVDAVPLAADHRGELRWDGLYSIVPRDVGYYLVSKSCWELLGTLVGF
jgi:uncharacterized SAM-binding protein YcdF (DUF218 family)